MSQADRNPTPIVVPASALGQVIAEDAKNAVDWRLEPPGRDLDANIIAIAPDGEIIQHIGPDLDVLLVILAGSGTLTTETGTVSLSPGEVVWLPRRAQRAITGGEHGLRYFSVHRRKPPLGIGRPSAAPSPN